MSSLFMADSNHRRLWSSERQIQQLGSYQMVSEPSPSTAILTTSMAPEGIAPLNVPFTEFSADLGTIIASIRHDFSRINSSLDRCIDHLKGSKSTALSEPHYGSPGLIDSDTVYEPRVVLHDEVSGVRNFSNPTKVYLPPTTPSLPGSSLLKGIRDLRYDSGRFSGFSSGCDLPGVGVSRSSSKLSFLDDLDDSCPFAVDDIPNSQLRHVDVKDVSESTQVYSSSQRSQAAAVGMLVQLLRTAPPLRQVDDSVKEKENIGLPSESMSSSGSIDIHETVVDTQSDSWVKILQEPQPKSTIASVLATTTESLKGVQALEIGSFENPNSTIDSGNLSCQGMEIAAGKLALDSGLRGVTDRIGAKQAKLELQGVVNFLMNPNECTELEAKIPQDCLLHPACITQQLQEMDNELLHGFMTAIQQNYGGKDLIQFENFAEHNAFNLLAKYGTSRLVFNDGIQGRPYIVLTSIFLLELKSACDVFVEMPHKVFPSHMHMGLLSFFVHELRAAVFRRRPPPEPPPNLFTQPQPMMELHLCLAEKFLLCKILIGRPMFARIHMNCSYYSKHILAFISGDFVVHMSRLRDCLLPKLDFRCSLAPSITSVGKLTLCCKFRFENMGWYLQVHLLRPPPKPPWAFLAKHL